MDNLGIRQIFAFDHHFDQMGFPPLPLSALRARPLPRSDGCQLDSCSLSRTVTSDYMRARREQRASVYAIVDEVGLSNSTLERSRDRIHLKGDDDDGHTRFEPRRRGPFTAALDGFNVRISLLRDGRVAYRVQ